MVYVLIIIISYLMGSISFSYLIGKTVKGIDIRDYGSGNAGATNTLRVLGKKYAAVTFLFDFLKGFLAVRVGNRLGGYNGALLACVFVVIGHNYSMFLNFKGGKGIATSIGLLYAINWKVGLIISIIGIVTVLLSKYVSLGSIIGAITAPIALYIVERPVEKNLMVTIIILAIFALIRHRDNIERLLKGVENKLEL